MEQANEILSAISARSESGLLLFFVLLTVFFLVLTVPVYSMVMNDRHKRRLSEERRREQDKSAEAERMSMIIGVVSQNSEAMSGLRTALDAFGHSLGRRLDQLGQNQEAVAAALSALRILDRTG